MFPSQRSLHVDFSAIRDAEDLYCFTRGRFVCNEKHEMAQRYVHYSLDGLANVAADAVGATSCVRIEPLPGGMYNKALLLTMDDGKQAVAKIPYPNAGQPHFTTASEVATMDYVRNVLGTPAPRIYAWSSRARETPVGAEFIVMEKVDGVPLDSVYGAMQFADRFAVARTIARYQGVWASASFEGYGSLYYAPDLKHQRQITQPRSPADGTLDGSRFAIGPTTGRNWNDDGRISVDFDRGPWNGAEQYLNAIGHREVACVKQLARLPASPITLCGPGTYQPTRSKKLRALQNYLRLVKILVPADPVVRKPCIWHGDLHVENIFVNPAKPNEVTGIIDWQSTEIAPLFVQARQPYFLDHEGLQSKGLERPRLPSNMAQLPAEEQQQANRLLLNQSLCAAYRILVHKLIPEVWKCFEFQETSEYDLLLFARSLLVDGEATYMAQLAELAQSESSVFASTRSAAGNEQVRLRFSGEERAEIQSDVEGALRGMDVMRGIQDSIGDLFPEKGMVRTEQYDEAKDALRQMKEQVIDEFARTEDERAAWRQAWPFDD